MFSGIIARIQNSESRIQNKQGIQATFSIPKGWKIVVGDSVNIDGICSTVEKISSGLFTVFWMPETIRRTSLSSLADEHIFNLEQPLTLQTFIDGHLVTGHVDTTAEVSSIKKSGSDVSLTFAIDEKWTKYLMYKGSITVNGVSLTIVERTSDSFTVSLIPYTLEHTNLGRLEIHDQVNIEGDMLAKYIEQLLEKD